MTVPTPPALPTPPPSVLTARGTPRRIDELGRVVVPSEMRHALGIVAGDLLDVQMVNGRIVMARIEHSCLFCAGAEDLVSFKNRLICGACNAELRTAT